ncbi:hypothetical protein [Prosthecomicrobium sp. N25]|uniref:hypothetical protein n=1 Tax=Prosthecomicrobium sp. N25 TaxID=3129254 RepID=UPI00307752B0
MPQVFVIAAVGAAALAGYKFVKREMDRVEKALKATRSEPVKAPVEAGTLVRGADGVYRPRG